MASTLKLVLIYMAVTTVAFEVVYRAQPTPFIDEVFHIPQAQKYCSGKFNEWDSKITTLPGMYISSLIALAPGIITRGASICTTWVLRYLNLLFNTASLIIAVYIFKAWSEKEKDSNDQNQVKPRSDESFSALAVAVFPLLYFYSFLYYTDPSSTFFVLLAYYACVIRRYSTSAVLGLISVIFRQSNIVWVVFMAGTVVARHLEGIAAINKVSASPELKDKLARFAAQLIAALLRYLLVIQNLMQLIILIWPYAAVATVFALFVYINDGIVVGDRSSHQSVLNLPQLLYFAAFCLFFGSPILVTEDKLKRFAHTIKKKLIWTVIFFLFCMYIIIYYTYVHDYLLADNRHYVFYLWRWLLGKRFVRILLIPIYLYSVWSMNDSLRSNEHCTILWRLVFLACVVGVLVPQKLLEFRYFILPYIFFRLHVKERRLNVILLEILFYIVINAFTIIVFVKKTFNWKDIEEPQRIIW